MTDIENKKTYEETKSYIKPVENKITTNYTKSNYNTLLLNYQTPSRFLRFHLSIAVVSVL